jgi:hypothetical protein
MLYINKPRLEQAEVRPMFALQNNIKKNVEREREMEIEMKVACLLSPFYLACYCIVYH